MEAFVLELNFSSGASFELYVQSEQSGRALLDAIRECVMTGELAGAQLTKRDELLNWSAAV